MAFAAMRVERSSMQKRLTARRRPGYRGRGVFVYPIKPASFSKPARFPDLRRRSRTA